MALPRIVQAVNARVSLAGDESISDVKTYTDSPVVPDVAETDFSQKTANTKFVKTAVRHAVDALQKQLNALEGTLLTFTPDSTVAYSKSIPANSFDYAAVNSFGGRSIVWNQLRNGFSGSVDGAGFNNVTTVGTKRTATMAGATGYLAYSYDRIKDHYYLVALTAQISVGYVEILSQDGTAYVRSTPTSGTTEQTIYLLFQQKKTSTNATEKLLQLRVVDSAEGASVSFDNFMYSDLTLAFSSGNEPSTVEAFRAIFPDSYYAYTEGEIKSAGVNKIVSRGKNLADISGGLGSPSNTASSTVTKRTFEIGKYIKGISRDNYYNTNNVAIGTATSNSIQFSNTTAFYGIGIPFNCEPGATYVSSIVVTGTEITRGFMWYASDGSFISYGNSLISTAPANAAQGLFVIISTTTNGSVTISNIQTEKGSAATAYSEPFKLDKAIPAEILALPGYGWSAGSVYNEIDWENKKYIQRVAQSTVSTVYEVGTSYTNVKYFLFGKPANYSGRNTYNGTITSPVLHQSLVSTDTFSLDSADNIGKILGTPHQINFWIGFPLGTTLSQAEAALVGTTFNYELATPIETDISALIDDNTIEVESGGTITFENALGDSYRIPVPSTVLTAQQGS